MIAEGDKKVRFDPTINLGHIVTFVGMIGTVIAIYSALDKRVALLELSQTQTAASVQEIRSDVKSIGQKVDDLRVQVRDK